MKEEKPNDQRMAVEGLWREALRTYREEGIEERLVDRWPDDGNVNGRISYRYPPTFQPGYVGPRYFAAEHRMVLIGQNPGEGSDPVTYELDQFPACRSTRRAEYLETLVLRGARCHPP